MIASVQFGAILQSASIIKLTVRYGVHWINMIVPDPEMPLKLYFSCYFNRTVSVSSFVSHSFDELAFCCDFSKSICVLCAGLPGTPTRKVLLRITTVSKKTEQNQHFSLGEVHVFVRYFRLVVSSGYKYYGNSLCWCFCGLSWLSSAFACPLNSLIGLFLGYHATVSWSGCKACVGLQWSDGGGVIIFLSWILFISF